MQSRVTDATAPQNDNDDALRRLMQVERSELLGQLLEALPEVQADALRLRFFGGLKFEEIAQAMGSSLTGAKQRVRRGLENLGAAIRFAEDDHGQS